MSLIKNKEAILKEKIESIERQLISLDLELFTGSSKYKQHEETVYNLKKQFNAFKRAFLENNKK